MNEVFFGRLSIDGRQRTVRGDARCVTFASPLGRTRRGEHRRPGPRRSPRRMAGGTAAPCILINYTTCVTTAGYTAPTYIAPRLRRARPTSHLPMSPRRPPRRAATRRTPSSAPTSIPATARSRS